MGQLFMVRRWVLVLLVGLTLVLALPGLGLAAGGGPGEGPGQGQGGEGLETATQQMFEGGVYGTVKVADNGDVYVVNRYGEPGANAPDFSRAANNGAGVEVYRIPVDKLKNATDADLDKFAKEIYGASDTILGTEMVGGKLRLMSQPQATIKDKLKQLQDAYKKGDVKFDTTAKTADQLRAALKTDPDIDAKLKGIEEIEKAKKVEKVPEQPKSKYGPKPLEISQPPAESTIASGSQALPETPTTSVTPVGVNLYDSKIYFDARGGFALGLNQTPSLSSIGSFTRRDSIDRFATNFQTQASPNLAGAAGASLGTWFDYACCRQRSWLKYFGFSLDYSHYGLDYGSRSAQFSKLIISRDKGSNLVLDGQSNLVLDGQRSLVLDGQRNFLLDGQSNFSREGERPLIGDGTFSSSGFVNSLGFMLNTRLPFDLPSIGHFEAQLGVGPTINIVTQQFTATLDRFRNRNGDRFTQMPTGQLDNNFRTSNGNNNSGNLNIIQQFNSQTVVTPGLQVNFGLKYYLTPHISLGPGVSYYHFYYDQNLSGNGGLSGKISFPVNEFNFTMGVRYNF